MSERKKPDACRPFRFCVFEIRIIERVAYEADGVESYTYEPMMTQKASVARYTATRNTAQKSCWSQWLQIDDNERAVSR